MLSPVFKNVTMVITTFYIICFQVLSLNRMLFCRIQRFVMRLKSTTIAQLRYLNSINMKKLLIYLTTMNSAKQVSYNYLYETWFSWTDIWLVQPLKLDETMLSPSHLRDRMSTFDLKGTSPLPPPLLLLFSFTSWLCNLLYHLFI